MAGTTPWSAALPNQCAASTEILPCALAGEVSLGQLRRGKTVAELGGLFEPGERLPGGLGHAAAFGIAPAERHHRDCIALVGGLAEPLGRFAVVLALRSIEEAER